MNNSRYKAFSLIEISVVILIIGILVTGVIQGSKLVDKMRLNTARSLTKSSPVVGISDLAYWFESTSEESFIESERKDGVTINHWYDINPSNVGRVKLSRTISGESIYAPKYQETSKINRLPTVKFMPRADYFLQYPAFTGESNFNGTEKYTLFVVGMYDKIFSGNNYGDVAGIDYELETCTFMQQGYKYAMWPDIGFVYASEDKQEKPVILSMTVDNLNSNTLIAGLMKLYFQGSYVAQGEMAEGCGVYYGYISKRNVVIGRFSGNVGEFIVYNRVLKDEERKAVEDYLSKKWAIPLSS